MNYYGAVIVSAVVLLSLFVVSGTVGAQENPETKIAGGLEDVENDTVEVVIAFEDGGGIGADSEADISVDDMKRQADRNRKAVEALADSEGGIKVKNSLWLANSVVASVDTNRTPFDRLASMDGVEQIHRNFEVEVHSTEARQPVSSEGTATPPALSPGVTEPSVSTNSFTYGLEQINAPDVWSEFGTRGQGSRVAVLDTGMNVSHPDLDLRNEDPGNSTYPGGWAEFDSNGNRVVGSEPKDFGDHGTHVSGTVAGGNASGTAVGVAPETELMHAAVLTDCSNGPCEGTLAQIVGGMQWAVDNNADVISMSLGVDGTFDAFIDPIRNAKNQGTFVVASAGNSGNGTSGSPGNVYDSVSVGASDSNRDIATFSGGEVIDTSQDWNSPPSDWPSEYVVPDVAAPGVFVESTLPNDNYGTKSGTSMAAPHVSGTAALMISAAGEDLSPDEIRSTLETTARKPDGWGEPEDARDTRYGFGIIDARNATALVAEDTAEYESGTISGVVTNSSNEPLPRTFVWAQEFVDEDGNRIEVRPDFANTSGVDGFVNLTSDDDVRDLTFTVEFDKNGTPTVDETFSATGDELRNVDLSARITAVSAPNVSAFDLLNFTNTAAEYKLGTLPAQDGDATPPGVDYKAVRAVQYATGDDGQTAVGHLRTEFSEAGNVVIPESEPLKPYFEVSEVGPQEPRVAQGNNLSVVANVTNTGETEDGAEVELFVNDSLEDTATTTVGVGETVPVAFDDVPISLEIGEYEYSVVTTNDSRTGNLTVVEQLFGKALIDRSSFVGPPTNTQEFNNTLYEDLSGDGDGKDVTQTVAVFGELIRGNDLRGNASDGGLTDEQARALNWNQGSPDTEVTPADMVSLFGEQIRAD